MRRFGVGLVVLAALHVAALAACDGPKRRAAPSVSDGVVRPASCAGSRLSGEQFDINLDTARLSGRVTLNGQALEPSNFPRGTLVFFDERSGSSQFIDLGTASSGALDVQLPKGTYRVHYVPSMCSESDSMPCTRTELESALVLQSDTVRNFNIRSVSVSLAVSLDGRVPSTLEGNVIFENAAGSSPLLRLRNARRIRVAPDTYRVHYLTETTCAAAEAWPCNRGVIANNLRIDGPQEVPLDVRTTVVRVELTVNGVPPSVRTSLSMFELVGESGDTIEIPVEHQILRSALEPMRVVRGRYRMYWAPIESPCSADSNMPCNRGMLAEFDANAPTSAVVANAEVIAIRGTALVDGSPVHQLIAQQQRGAVFAIIDDKALEQFASVGEDSSFALRLFKGTRAALGFRSMSANCFVSPNAPDPCGEAVFAPSSVWDNDRALDASVRTHSVQVAVTIDDQLVSSSAAQPTLGLQWRGISRAPLLTTRFGAPPSRLIEGTYSIAALNSPGASECDRAAPVPCGAHTIARARSITSDATIELSARTRRLSGAIRVGGAPLILANRLGSTSITGFFSPETAAISPIAFDQPATYNVRFMDAPVVGYIHANAACSMDEPSASTGAPALCGLSFVSGCE